MTPIDARCVDGMLTPRPSRSHKGSFGLVCIVGGAPGLAGAALLAGRAALQIGAGRVRVACLDPRVALDMNAPELMIATLDQALSRTPDVIAVGPGLGTDADARQAIGRCLSLESLLVLDADGLNLIAQDASFALTVTHRAPGQTLLTPHPGEAARLLNTDIDTVQRDRPAALEALIARFHCAVALKGSPTLCGFPNGARYENTTGNPGLSTAGAGDVLTGLIAGLAGQLRTVEKAALLGVYLHGLAADRLTEQGVGPIGLRAGELIEAARMSVNTLVYGSAKHQP